MRSLDLVKVLLGRKISNVLDTGIITHNYYTLLIISYSLVVDHGLVRPQQG